MNEFRVANEGDFSAVRSLLFQKAAGHVEEGVGDAKTEFGK